MSNSIILSSELKAVVDERIELWADVGRAKSIANDVMILSSKIPEGNVGTPVGQLVDTANPPAEIIAVLSALRSEVESISRLDTDIQNTTNSISQLQQQRLMMMIFGVIGGFLLLWFLLAQLTPFV